MSREIQSARDAVLVASGTEFAACTALNAAADVVADVTFASGDTVEDFQLHKGYNPIKATKVVYADTSIWALYTEIQS